MRKGGKMLVLRPALLSSKPLRHLISEAHDAAENYQQMSTACVWLGGGLLVGFALIHMASQPRSPR
jgi:hypothetical protein